MASGLDGTVQVFCTMLGFFLIDKIGRRHALGGGAAIMGLSLLVSQPPANRHSASSRLRLTYHFLLRSMVLSKPHTPINPTPQQIPVTSSSSSSSLSVIPSVSDPEPGSMPQR